MEWLTAFRGRVIGLDTAPVIYFIEEHPIYLPTVDPFFSALDHGDFTVVTSIMTLLEVLVHPFRRNDSRLAQQYRNILLNSEKLKTLFLSQDIAEETARIRARYNIHTPDAIQMATAIHGGAEFFLTNDSGLPSLPDLKVITLSHLKAAENEEKKEA
jgi:predicted nucleic acid-binding protein